MKRTYRPRALLLLAFAIGATAGVSCRGQNDEHCSFNEGNATCLARYPDGSRPYCTNSCMPTQGQDGCSDERPEDDACYSPCGGDKTADECESAMGESSSEGSGSGGPTSVTAESSVGPTTMAESSEGDTVAGCVDDDACGGETPFCSEDGVCVSCEGVADPDAACEGESADAPVCFEGACVACTADHLGACAGDTPVCDVATLSCKPCAYHNDCPDSACNALDGTCLEATPVQVGPNQTHTTIAAALQSVPQAAHAVFIVHNNSGNLAYQEPLPAIEGGRVVALLAAEDNPRPRITGDGAPTFTVNGGTLLIEGLDIRGNSSGLGIQVTGGGLVVDRTEITGNNHGGVELLSGTEAIVRNTIIGRNGNDTDAIVVENSTAELVYVTLMATAEFSTPAALRCNAAATVEVRNAILLANGVPDVVCNAATISHSAGETAPNGTDNVAVGGVMVEWWENLPNSNLRLSAAGGAVFGGIASWETGDPLTDIGETARPATDGAPDYAGAHIPE